MQREPLVCYDVLEQESTVNNGRPAELSSLSAALVHRDQRSFFLSSFIPCCTKKPHKKTQKNFQLPVFTAAFNAVRAVKQNNVLITAVKLPL